MKRFPSRLLQGYRQFKDTNLASESVAAERYRVLSEAGQRPETMVISCCDSRAAPETIFDAAPGELFVVRNVANLVPTYQPDGEYHGTSAAIEFAVGSLRVSNVVVMGHGKCGGINGYLTPGALDASKFLKPWLSILDPLHARMEDKRVLSELHEHEQDNVDRLAVELEFSDNRHGLLKEVIEAVAESGASVENIEASSATGASLIVTVDEWAQIESLQVQLESIHGVVNPQLLVPSKDHASKVHELELASVAQSLDNLRTFPLIDDLVRVGDLNLYGGWFDISSGQLLTYDNNDQKWTDALT